MEGVCEVMEGVREGYVHVHKKSWSKGVLRRVYMHVRRYGSQEYEGGIRCV